MTNEPNGDKPVFEALPVPLKLGSVVIRLLRLPLKEGFETSFGRVENRLIFLLEIKADGVTGWGEVVAFEEPIYGFETVQTAVHAVRDFLAPALLASPITSLDDVPGRFSRFRGHNMARAGLELAVADLSARILGQSLSRFLGGIRERVEVGVSIGIQPSVKQLLDCIESYTGLGYRRIKLKIRPGWDADIVAEVRKRYPGIALSVDANSAYDLRDIRLLKPLDGFGLLMIEQPLHHDDLVDHAKLQSQFVTPICLDESINGLRQAKQALDLGSCRILNIKVGRVGGYTQALPIHDLCYSRRTPVWCGGMLESGIGRAHNIALASLAGFTLPGDISASARYFERDLINPEVSLSSDSTVVVPTGSGLGFEIDREYIDSRTVSTFHIRSDR